jgi:hypothetical protein
MSDTVLTIADVTGIQGYVFGSNRLRDNVGASELVACATGEWVVKALQAIGHTNITGDANSRIDPNLYFEQGLDAELLYSGGGNAVVIFRNVELARAWSARLSAQVLREAPGLNLVVAHSVPFTWQPDEVDLAERIGKLINNDLAMAKQYRAASTPLLGLGVTAACRSTGLPAVAIDDTDDDKPISREIKAKIDARDDADKRFRQLLKDFRYLDLQLPSQLDDLGRSDGERSYIAVVHADGNGMGKRFKAAWKHRTNREAIKLIRALSDAVNKAGENALLDAFSRLVTDKGKLLRGQEEFAKQKYLPFRPIIYGGDDVTFVCDGRLGLGLAAAYLSALEHETKDLPDGKGSLSACAGIAIVKTHYPFRRAYDLSEALCKGAKETLGREHSSLDWHIAMSGLLADIETIRRREYTIPPVPGGNKPRLLTMRPLLLKESETWRTWPQFHSTITKLQSEWAGRRNKVKQLREVLREDPERTSQFLKLYRMGDLPGYAAAPSTLREQGWLDGICGYFDPIEALDFYIPL